MKGIRRIKQISKLIEIILFVMVILFTLTIAILTVLGIMAMTVPDKIDLKILYDIAGRYSYSIKEYGTLLLMDAVSYIILEIIVILGFMTFKRMSKSNTPFETRNVKMMKIIVGMLILLAFLPAIVQFILMNIIKSNALYEESFDFTFLWIAIIVYCITLIFEYGCEVQKKADETIKIQEEIILSLAEISEAKSGETGKHVKRMSEYCYILAKEMGFPEEELDIIKYSSMMHDIGKLLTPLKILEKKGKLTDKEFDEIKEHVVNGEKLLHNASGEIMEKAKIIALEHHEKWNGEGYLNMKGEEIHLISRIAAVADVFDALTSKRSYKKAWTIEKAYDLIISEDGKHFDPKVVEAFKKSFDEIKKIHLKYQD